jgi:putative ABC transport system permease protein
MNGLLQDFRYALRQLHKKPGFSATVVLTIVLAIGVSTAVFSVAYATLVRPLPYHRPDRIVVLDPGSPQGYNQPASYPEYLDWRRNSHSFSALAAFNGYGSANLEGPSGPVAVRRVASTDNFSDVFGVAPYLGRSFRAGEDQPGRSAVAVLSYELRQQYFGADKSALGQTLKLNGLPYTVIGVMPAEFRYPINDRNTVYVPLHMSKELAEARGSHWLPTVGRLKDGVSLAQAATDMNRVLDDIGRAFPQSSGRRMKISSVAASIVGNSESPLKVLTLAVLALLAIGCVNVAGLLLARGVRREREVVVRAAVGAARLRILRQMLTESFLLACLGAGAGIAVAQGLLASIRTLLISALARGGEIRLDSTALVVSLALAVLTTLLAGIGPALRLSSIAPNTSLKTGGSTGSSRTQQRIRSASIAAQMALALLLLATLGLLARVLIGLRSTDLGFNPEHLLTSEIDLSTSKYEGRDAFENFYRPLIDKLRAIPGVRFAGLIQVLPIQNWGWNSDIHITGHPPDPPNQERLAEDRYVSSSYFDTMGIRLLRGRLLDEGVDTRSSQPVMVVNEAFVKKFFAEGEDPIGQHIDRATQPLIIGVVRNVRQNVYEPPVAEMDFPISQIPRQDSMQAVPTMSLVIRTGVDTNAIVPNLRRVFHQLDPGLPFREPSTMREVVSDVLVLERLENWLFGTFASLAVLLAIVGLYGLISHEVELSIRDIGVRVALGATRLAVLASVYRRVAVMLGAGVLGGLLLVAGARRLISALVPLDRARDLQVVIALAGCLFLVGIIAVLMPAKRASEVDPMAVLRYE